MQEFIRVINFEKYQHYNKTKCYMKNPPWLKLYSSMLNSYPFCDLDDAKRYHAIGLVVLASQYDNKIPANPRLIQKKLHAKEPIDIQSLIDAEFIEYSGVSIDNSLDSSTTEQEKEQDKEQDKRLLKDCRVNCVDNVDNFLNKVNESLDNKWFSSDNSKYAWLWTDSQAEQFIKGLEKSGYISFSNKSLHVLADEAAYSIFCGVFKETRPIEKAVNALLKSFNKKAWSTPKGYD